MTIKISNSKAASSSLFVLTLQYLTYYSSRKCLRVMSSRSTTTANVLRLKLDKAPITSNVPIYLPLGVIAFDLQKHFLIMGWYVYGMA